MKRNLRVASAYFLIFATFLNVISVFNELDHDMLHEMCLGREIVELGRVPWRDSFAYTATVYPLVHHEWGTGLLMYSLLVTAGLGATGLMIIKYAMSFATMGLAVRSTRHQGGAWPVIVALSPIAIAMCCFGFQTIRAQCFTLLFSVVLLNLFVLDRKGHVRWTLWWLVLYVVWLNLHAGFLVGIGLYGCHLIERTAFCFDRERSFSGTWRQTRHLYLTLAAMSVLWLVNPYFWHYGVYLIYAVRLERPLISEWHWIGAEASSAPVLLPVFSLALLLVVYAMTQRSWKQLPGLLMIAITAWESFWHVRHVTVFALVWFSYAPGYISPTGIGQLLRKPWNRYPGLVSSAMIVLGVLALLEPLANGFWQLRITTQGADSIIVYPAGAVDYLERTKFSGNLMVPFNSSAYVSWRLAPRVKVSVDSRYEVAYETEWVERNLAFYDVAPGWKSTLKEYPTDAILVFTGSSLMEALQANLSDKWQKRYEDPNYCLFFPVSVVSHYPLEVREQIPPATFP